MRLRNYSQYDIAIYFNHVYIRHMTIPTLPDIIARLQALGVRQTEIAKATKIPQGTVSRILNGEHTNPRYKTVSALLAYLDSRESE